MHEIESLGLLRVLCANGPQMLSKVNRGAVDNLIERGLASVTKRGLAVGATTKGYALHKATSPVGAPGRYSG